MRQSIKETKAEKDAREEQEWKTLERRKNRLRKWGKSFNKSLHELIEQLETSLKASKKEQSFLAYPSARGKLDLILICAIGASHNYWDELSLLDIQDAIDELADNLRFYFEDEEGREMRIDEVLWEEFEESVIGLTHPSLNPEIDKKIPDLRRKLRYRNL